MQFDGGSKASSYCILRDRFDPSKHLKKTPSTAVNRNCLFACAWSKPSFLASMKHAQIGST